MTAKHNWHDLCSHAASREMGNNIETSSSLLLALPRLSTPSKENCYGQSLASLNAVPCSISKIMQTGNGIVISPLGCAIYNNFWLHFPLIFLAVLRELHEGMTSRVLVGGQESEPFFGTVGVNQGCVLAPVICNLFLVAIALVFFHGISEDDGIAIALMEAYSTSDICSPQP